MTLMRLFEVCLRKDNSGTELDICLVLASTQEQALAILGSTKDVTGIRAASDWTDASGNPRILGWTAEPMPGIRLEGGA